MSTIEIFRALGDPVRLKIVQMVAQAGELCVCRIVEELDMTQPAVSHHLAKLRYSRLLKARKQGQWVYYSLNYEILEKYAMNVLRELVQTASSTQGKSVHC